MLTSDDAHSLANPAALAARPVRTRASEADDAEGEWIVKARAANFVGRSRELEQLEAGYAAAKCGLGQLFMLAGESGIGKTRLADVVAGIAHDDDALVLWGRCWPGGGAPVYWPWVQVIRGCLANLDNATAAKLMSHSAPRIAQIVPEVVDLIPGINPVTTADSDHARFDLFDAVTTFLRRFALRRPLVLILDDLHVSDTSSLLLLRFLARDLRGTRLLVVGSYRDIEAALSAEHVDLLGAIGREGRTLLLKGLAETEVAELVGRLLGERPSRALVARLCEGSGGNPFFVQEAVSVLMTELEGEHTDPEVARLPISEGMRSAVHARLQPLAARDKSLLSVASVLGKEFGLDALRAVAGRDRDDLLEGLQRAMSAGIVYEVPGTFDRYRFAHDLVRESLYDELQARERARLHEQVGEGLERLYGDDLDAHLHELAHHFFQAARAGEVEKAVDYCERAGEKAMRLLAYEEAVSRFERALNLVHLPHPDEGRACRLLVRLGAAQMRAGRPRNGRGSLQEAARLAKKVGNAEALARAALLSSDWPRQICVPDHSLIRLLEEALFALGEEETPLRARVLARLAESLRWSGCPELVELLSNEAVEIARRAGGGSALAFALQSREVALCYPKHADELLAVCNERIELADADGDVELALTGRYDRIALLMGTGDRAAINHEIDAFTRQASELRQPLLAWRAIVLHAGHRMLGGHLAEAERLLMDAFAMGERLDGRMSFPLMPLLSFLSLETGREADFLPLLGRLLDDSEGGSLVRSQRAYLHVHQGDEASARLELAVLASNGFAAIPEDRGWLSSMALLAEVCAIVKSREDGIAVYEKLLPYAHLHVTVAPSGYFGPVAYYLGLLATMLSRWGDAEEHFRTAVVLAERIVAPVWNAKAGYAWARMLIARGLEEDVPAARALLARAIGNVGHLDIRVTQEACALNNELCDRLPESDPDSTARVPQATLQRNGDYWVVQYGTSCATLKDTKGCHYLAQLVRNPNTDVHVLDLISLERCNDGGNPPAMVGGVSDLVVRGDLGDAGEILDSEAKRAYKRRLMELRDDVDEAEALGDVERAARANEEIRFLARELAAAVGLGGRDRKAASSSERARVSVTKAIKGTIRKIRLYDELLADHLEKSVKTGYFCSYAVHSDGSRGYPQVS